MTEETEETIDDSGLGTVDAIVKKCDPATKMDTAWRKAHVGGKPPCTLDDWRKSWIKIHLAKKVEQTE